MDDLKKKVAEIEDEISNFNVRTDEIICDMKARIEEQEEYIETIEQALLDLENERDEAELKEVLIHPAFSDADFEAVASNAHEIRLLADDIREKRHKRWIAAQKSEQREALAQKARKERDAKYEAERPAREKEEAAIEKMLDSLMASSIEWKEFSHGGAFSHCHRDDVKAHTGTEGLQANMITARLWRRLRGE